MANPYKNTNRAGTSPFNHEAGGGLKHTHETRDLKYHAKRVFNNMMNPPSNVQNLSIGNSGLGLVGPGGALKGGKKLFDIGKSIWNMGKKGGIGYAKPVATGRNLNTIIQKKIGGKPVEFEKFAGFKVTPKDIAKAKSLTKPYKVAGTIGRTGVYGAGISGIVNYGDSGYSEIEEAVVKQDQIYDRTKTYADEINKRNQTFETPKEDEKNK